MYFDRTGTDKNHPGQNLPDKRPLTIQLVLSVKDAYFYQSHLQLGRIP